MKIAIIQLRLHLKIAQVWQCRLSSLPFNYGLSFFRWVSLTKLITANISFILIFWWVLLGVVNFFSSNWHFRRIFSSDELFDRGNWLSCILICVFELLLSILEIECTDKIIVYIWLFCIIVLRMILFIMIWAHKTGFHIFDRLINRSEFYLLNVIINWFFSLFREHSLFEVYFRLLSDCFDICLGLMLAC